jgi:SAM-dependent methyltransferase
MNATPASTESDQGTPVLPQVPSPLVHPLEDNELLIGLLAEVLGQPRERVRRILYEEECDLAGQQKKDFRQRRLEPHVWSKALADFYEQTDAFVYGNVAWNRRPAKLDMRRWVGEHLTGARPGGARVLTIGDGLGFDSLFLAKCGFEVTYSELSTKNREFASKIFALNSVPVNVAEDMLQLEEEAYDVVVCLDVLEHVPEPVEFVSQLVRRICPKGLLVVHAPFYFVSPHNPTHLESNRRFSGDLSKLYRSSALELVDGRFFWNPLVFVKTTVGERPPASRRVRRLLLRCSGLLLSIGRVWSAPHNLVAARAMTKRDPQWAEGLASERELQPDS